MGQSRQRYYTVALETWKDLRRPLTTVPALTMDYPVDDPTPPKGWDVVVHPEGSRYFVHTEKRTSTKIDICDEETREGIERHIDELRNQLTNKKPQLDMKDVDLVIESMASGVSGYYFINHRNKCLFWLDDFDVEARLPQCKGIKSLARIGLAIRAQYWKYWHCFPHLCLVTEDLVCEVKTMLKRATRGHLASDRLCNVSVVQGCLSDIEGISGVPGSQNEEYYRLAIVIGRTMCASSYNAFLIFNEEAAHKRRDAEHASWTPSRWMVIVAPFLFLELSTRIRELQKIFTDDAARMVHWNAFSSRMKSELEASNLLATVFINAEVVLLGVVKSGGNYATQVTTYASLATSLGSLVLGLFFVSQYRISGQSVTDSVLSSPSKLSLLLELYDVRHGHINMVIIYSLPKALLMWSIVFFFVTFLIDWWTSGDTASRVFVGAVILLTSVVIISGSIRTTEGGLWWWTDRLRMVIGPKISRTQRNDDHGPETKQFLIRIPPTSSSLWSETLEDNSYKA